MFATRRKGSLVGLDITTSSVKLIELVESGRGYRVESYAAEPTPPNAINEKAIVDADAVGEAIRRAHKRAGTKTREAAIAISGDAAITKVIQMPKNLSATDLEGQVELQADQYIPFPMEEVSFDFEVIGDSERDPDMVDVLLVATRTENVEQRQVAVEAAGLQARVVDVEAFAVENACQLLTHQMPDAGADKFIAIVDFGASTTTFSVLKDLKVIYTRDFAFGGQQLTEEIMRTYGLSMEDAGRAKKEGGLPSNYQPEVLDAFIDDMSQQVSRSLQFFLASGSGREQPDQILICGGCANIPGVADVIGSRVGVAHADRRSAGPNEDLGPRQVAGRGSGCHRLVDRMRPRIEELRLMPRINLLPWRTELRQRRKKEFLVALAGTLIVAAGVVYVSKLTVQGWTSAQQGRNQILRGEIAELDKQIAEITSLESQRERLLARMQVITQLQRSRPEVVHLFDELVNAIPEGVNLIEVVQQGSRVELRGAAQSSTRVSALMRNIDDSEWLRDPGLDVVEIRRPRASIATRSSRCSRNKFRWRTPAEGEAAEGAAQ